MTLQRSKKSVFYLSVVCLGQMACPLPMNKYQMHSDEAQGHETLKCPVSVIDFTCCTGNFSHCPQLCHMAFP